MPWPPPSPATTSCWTRRSGPRWRATRRAGRGRQHRGRLLPGLRRRARRRSRRNERCSPSPGRRDRRSRCAWRSTPARPGSATRATTSGGTIVRTARLRALAHGGQVLVSSATHDLVVDELPAPVELVDLGTHRLKDLARPEHVWQLAHPELESEFPPLRVARQHPEQPARLPVHVHRPLRRDRHDRPARARQPARDPHGSGRGRQDRLAQQVGAELVETFRDGVWWVDLVGVQDPALLAVRHQPRRSVRRGPRRSPGRGRAAAGRPAGAAHPGQLRAPGGRVRRGERQRSCAAAPRSRSWPRAAPR